MNSQAQIRNKIPIPILYSQKQETTLPPQPIVEPQYPPAQTTENKPKRRVSDAAVPAHRVVQVSIRSSESIRMNKNNRRQSVNANVQSHENGKSNEIYAHRKQY